MITFSKMFLSPGVYTETKEPKSHNRKQQGHIYVKGEYQSTKNKALFEICK